MPINLSPLRVGQGACPGGAINRANPLNVGLVSRWLALPGRMSGPKWYDVAGTNHGTFSGAPRWSATARPGGLGEVRFAGFPDYVDLGTPPSLIALEAPMTVSAWFKPDGVAGFQTIFARYTGAGLVYTFRLDSASLSCYISIPSSYQFFSAPTAVTAGVWHFAAFVVGGTTSSPTLRVILDGQDTSFSPSALDPTPNAAVPLSIGASQAGSEMLSGAIDDVRAWSRALSVTEIASVRRLSGQGDPGVLNRSGPSAAAFDAAAAAQSSFPATVVRQAVKRSSFY